MMQGSGLCALVDRVCALIECRPRARRNNQKNLVTGVSRSQANLRDAIVKQKDLLFGCCRIQAARGIKRHQEVFGEGRATAGSWLAAWRIGCEVLDYRRPSSPVRAAVHGTILNLTLFQ
jgi:hypothetical protein